ncbi:MAG: hypothetical protein WA960_19145 [Tunicatimonas sp.]
MMDRFQEFEQRVNRALVKIDAKITGLHESTEAPKSSFTDFKEEVGDFMQFMADHVSDHEQRLTSVEKRLDALDQ